MTLQCEQCPAYRADEKRRCGHDLAALWGYEAQPCGLMRTARLLGHALKSVTGHALTDHLMGGVLSAAREGVGYAILDMVAQGGVWDGVVSVSTAELLAARRREGTPP